MTAFIGNYCQKWYNISRNFNSFPNFPNAIKIYDNLDSYITWILIKKDNHHKAGIYCFYNKINNKFYIGSAITNRIHTRFKNHLNNSSTKYEKNDLTNSAGKILDYQSAEIETKLRLE